MLQSRLSNCLDAVSSWMAANRLQLNSDKTEALWCSSARRQYQIPTRPVRVGCTSVRPVTVVCICATCHCRQESRDLPGWRRQHAHSRHYNCLGMLCHPTPNTQCASFPTTSSHADLASVPCYQQTGLLWFCDGRCT